MILSSMHGKLVCVSASTKGIGKACVEHLWDMGLDILAMGRNPQDLHLLSQHFHEQKNKGATQHFYTLCVDHQNLQEIKEKLTSFNTIHPIDILIHISGGPKSGNLINSPTEELSTAFDQHLLSAQIMAQIVTPNMKKNHWGRIITVISTSVKTPLPNLGVSNVIRAAMSSWTKTLANELGEFGICVNSVLPGYIQTDRLTQIIKDKALKMNTSEEHVIKLMQEQIPAKRFGQAKELANLIGFLVTPGANYINGTSICVDGGRTPCI